MLEWVPDSCSENNFYHLALLFDVNKFSIISILLDCERVFKTFDILHSATSMSQYNTGSLLTKCPAQVCQLVLVTDSELYFWAALN